MRAARWRTFLTRARACIKRNERRNGQRTAKRGHLPPIQRCERWTSVGSRAEKQRQFSSPTTPRFEQSSAGYHRLPPAIAVTLAAASRRQFHWHSPAPPAFTGSTSIHRLHRIVMGRYIDNSSGVKMVYLQLPIYTEVQIYLYLSIP